uniref:Glutamate decarboxylase 1 n=1 Tax=Laticauda laticaudata TaxID=8630 RepID=A0A8C5WWI3_LATLA
PTQVTPSSDAFRTYDTWCGVAHGCTKKIGLKICGFLQRNNSLEDKSRLVSALKDRQSSRNLLACENSEKEGRFQKTETDFSNLFARGKRKVPILLSPSPAAPSRGFPG